MRDLTARMSCTLPDLCDRMDTKFPRDNAVTDGGYVVQVRLIDAVCAIKEHIAKCKNIFK